MNRPLHRCLPFILGLLACVVLSVPANAATTAGRVVFALGQPRATDGAGAERVLARGDEVYSGDSLATAARERLQLSMADGAFISVQPDSTYVIQDYVYSGTPDGTEKANYQLVKGGIRALTGLIGKSRPEAYQVNTAVATIGIRGTGHNTRICQGDCGSLPDGLYHNTWEGITFVANNVDSKDVPTNRGVYVKNINSLIEFLQQASGVTAAVVTVAERREEEEQDPRPVLQEGERQQVTTTVSVLPDFLMALTTSDPNSPDITGDFGFNEVHGFFNSRGQLIGALFTEPPDSSSTYAEIRTIDLTAMQSGSDPVAAQRVNDVLTALASDSTLASNIDLLNMNPASVAEFFADATMGIGWGRWANGHVLSVFFDSGSESFSEITDLVNNQSAHFIYGPEPPAMLPATGMASYNFLGGTQSTSLSGATIGEGVTGGTISFDFATAFGTLEMDINHNSILYGVNADLFASTVEFIFGGGDAFTSDSSSLCVDGCSTSLIGSFAGATSDGNPQFINFQYQVDESDPFIGVASFQFGSVVVPSSTVMPIGGFLAVSEDSTDPFDPVDVTLGDTATGFFNASGQLIGILFTSLIIEDFGNRDFGTFDLDGVLGGDDSAAVAEVQSLFDTNSNAASSAATVAANPASVAEFYHDTTNGIGWGRWANGDFLTFDDTGNGAEVISLANNQSVHFIFGNPSGDLSGLTSTAFYSLITSGNGGTQSTSLSGATIGNGVVDGTIIVDFSLGEASIGMTVEHDIFTYDVSGTLLVDAVDATMTDAFLGAVFATSDSPTCISCDVEIDAAFANPAVTSGEPQFIGVGYDILEPDIIIGVAGFEYFLP